jgi:hypothetical protein
MIPVYPCGNYLVQHCIRPDALSIHSIKTLEISEYSNVSFVNILVALALISLYGNQGERITANRRQSTIHNRSRQFPRRDFQ